MPMPTLAHRILEPIYFQHVPRNLSPKFNPNWHHSHTYRKIYIPTGLISIIPVIIIAVSLPTHPTTILGVGWDLGRGR